MADQEEQLIWKVLDPTLSFTNSNNIQEEEEPENISDPELVDALWEVDSNHWRTPGKSPFSYPYHCSGRLRLSFEGASRELKATGTLVGRNVVLTAAHNVYKGGRLPKRILFQPGYHLQTSAAGTLACAVVYVSPQYKSTGNVSFDYAILLLREKLPASYGYYLPGVPTHQHFRGKNIRAYGYPKSRQYKPMIGVPGKVEGIDEPGNLLYHDMVTDVGHSGAGILYARDGKVYQIGIHAEAGLAVRINDRIIRDIQEVKKTQIV